MTLWVSAQSFLDDIVTFRSSGVDVIVTIFGDFRPKNGVFRKNDPNFSEAGSIFEIKMPICRHFLPTIFFKS
jgi:hypothetical protein